MDADAVNSIFSQRYIRSWPDIDGSKYVKVIRSIIYVYLCIDDFHGFPLKTFIYRGFPIATFDYQSVCLCSRVYYQSVLPMLCHEFVSPASVDFSCKRSEFVQKSVFFFPRKMGEKYGYRKCHWLLWKYSRGSCGSTSRGWCWVHGSRRGETHVDFASKQSPPKQQNNPALVEDMVHSSQVVYTVGNLPWLRPSAPFCAGSPLPRYLFATPLLLNLLDVAPELRFVSKTPMATGHPCFVVTCLGKPHMFCWWSPHFGGLQSQFLWLHGHLFHALWVGLVLAPMCASVVWWHGLPWCNLWRWVGSWQPKIVSHLWRLGSWETGDKNHGFSCCFGRYVRVAHIGVFNLERL